MNEFKRAIVREVVQWEESASIGRKSYSWKRIEVHTLTAECGHKRIKRGFSGVSKFIICKQCAAGKPRVEITEPLGRLDYTVDEPIRDPLARALIEGKGGGV